MADPDPGKKHGHWGFTWFGLAIYLIAALENRNYFGLQRPTGHVILVIALLCGAIAAYRARRPLWYWRLTIWGICSVALVISAAWGGSEWEEPSLPHLEIKMSGQPAPPPDAAITSDTEHRFRWARFVISNPSKVELTGLELRVQYPEEVIFPVRMERDSFADVRVTAKLASWEGHVEGDGKITSVPAPDSDSPIFVIEARRLAPGVDSAISFVVQSELTRSVYETSIETFTKLRVFSGLLYYAEGRFSYMSPAGRRERRFIVPLVYDGSLRHVAASKGFEQNGNCKLVEIDLTTLGASLRDGDGQSGLDVYGTVAAREVDK